MIIITIIIFISIIIILHRAHFHVTLDMMVIILLKQKNKLQSHKNLCENKDFWNIVISSECTKILEFYQYQKSDNTICYLCRPSISDRKD